MNNYDIWGTFSVHIEDNDGGKRTSLFPVLVKYATTIDQLETVLGNVIDNMQLITDGWPTYGTLSLSVRNPGSVTIDNDPNTDLENVVVLGSFMVTELGRMQTVYVPCGRKALFLADGSLNMENYPTGFVVALNDAKTYLTWISHDGADTGGYRVKRLTMHRSNRPRNL